jgi:hypothetical protein
MNASWAKSDEQLEAERAAPAPAKRAKIIYDPCAEHVWGPWMTLIGMPWGNWRRDCKKCKAEQWGRGPLFHERAVG